MNLLFIYIRNVTDSGVMGGLEKDLGSRCIAKEIAFLCMAEVFIFNLLLFDIHF